MYTVGANTVRERNVASKSSSGAYVSGTAYLATPKPIQCVTP
jgi:hypothetical protein